MKHRGECGVADDTAQDGDGIKANLHYGEEHPRIFLHFQDPLGIKVAIIGEQLKFDVTGCGQRDFRYREKCTDSD
jgi:hypothetical protein